MGRIFWEIVKSTITTNLYNHPRSWVLDVNTASPSEEEIAKAIQNQFKTKRMEKLQAFQQKILEGDVNTSTQKLYEIYAKVWEEETIPENWKENHLVKVPKKGDLANCKYQEKPSAESSRKG